ncbi:response regulator [Methylotenera oryzisoli]|uniref:Response regulator n=1 Tax=Methylotenera oryzisoli TaxID=2080758 RepID=A0A4Y9VS04_9PROT|nr:response regulator [Methylotenera oryzisoli]TFW71877.1 response regulator [Methylotenera oryzisoli]
MERMLIIDDEYELLNSLQLAFGYDEYKISQAKNEQQAIDMAEAVQPEIIIMNMPGQTNDGIKAFRKLKEIPQLRNSNIIVLSAQSQHDAILKEINDNTTYFIPKPFRQEDLTTALSGIRTKRLQSNQVRN